MSKPYTKAFRFRQLPAPAQDPAAWRRHLLEDYPVELPPRNPLSVAEATQVVARHMPELSADLEALLGAIPDQPWAPTLAMYNQPPFWAGCSVTVGRRPDRTTLLRNYDLGIDDYSGVLRCERLPAGGWMLGSAEAGWGYMDGLNSRGLSVAITFGGRYEVGDGFDCPLIVRYLLQTAATVEKAIAILERLPHRLVQNYVLLDRSGAHAVVYASPDRGVSAHRGLICSTNHQGKVDVERHAAAVRTVERFDRLQELNGTTTLADLLKAPFYQRAFDRHFGTIYSVEFDPVGGTARYLWPERDLTVTPRTPDCDFDVTYEGI